MDRQEIMDAWLHREEQRALDEPWDPWHKRSRARASRFSPELDPDDLEEIEGDDEEEDNENEL